MRACVLFQSLDEFKRKGIAMGILEGKRGLIVGIANDRSIASGITESVLAQGGQCLFTHLPGEKWSGAFACRWRNWA